MTVIGVAAVVMMVPRERREYGQQAQQQHMTIVAMIPTNMQNPITPPTTAGTLLKEGNLYIDANVYKKWVVSENDGTCI